MRKFKKYSELENMYFDPISAEVDYVYVERHKKIEKRNKFNKDNAYILNQQAQRAREFEAKGGYQPTRTVTRGTSDPWFGKYWN